MVLEGGLQVMQRFYEVYARGLETGQLSTQDWQIVENVQQMHRQNSEQQDMLQRLLYSVERGRLKVNG